jgi:hypothetical protein
MRSNSTVGWKTKCRCGAPLAYSCEDIQSGQPAEGADYWCSDGNSEKGPHDWGVVVYRGGEPQQHGAPE